MGTHVVATRPFYPPPPLARLPKVVCRWLGGIWCVQKLLERFLSFVGQKVENL